MEPAKRVIRRVKWTQKWMQRCHRNVTRNRLRAVGSPLPNHAAQVPPAVCAGSNQSSALGSSGQRDVGLNQVLQVPAVKGPSSSADPGRAPGGGNSSFPSFPSHPEALSGWLPKHPRTREHSVTVCWLSCPTCTRWVFLVWLGPSPALSQAFPCEGVTSFSLDFIPLLASPSLSFSQQLMSFLRLERKLVRAQGWNGSDFWYPTDSRELTLLCIFGS